jgi:hypothetical protein
VANGTGGRDEGGGGIYTGGTLLVDGSTISANTAEGSAGISAVGTSLTVRNSTIANNVAYFSDGGLGVDLGIGRSLLVQNSTITANTAAYYGAGAFIEAYEPALLDFQSTIVASNAEPLGFRPTGVDLYVYRSDYDQFSLTADHSLIGVADGIVFEPGSSNNVTGTLAAPLGPRLGPLGNNGGRYQPVRCCPAARPLTPAATRPTWPPTSAAPRASKGSGCGVPLDVPAASALTSFVVSGLPQIPRSPFLTSSITTQVTARRFSPSIAIIVSVSFRTISCFCAGVKTPSISFTVTRGISFLR